MNINSQDRPDQESNASIDFEGSDLDPDQRLALNSIHGPTSYDGISDPENYREAIASPYAEN